MNFFQSRQSFLDSLVMRRAQRNHHCSSDNLSAFDPRHD
jgi:hypothetical protein